MDYTLIKYYQDNCTFLANVSWTYNWLSFDKVRHHNVIFAIAPVVYVKGWFDDYGSVLGPHKHFTFFNLHTFFCKIYTFFCKFYTFFCKFYTFFCKIYTFFCKIYTFFRWLGQSSSGFDGVSP